MTQLLSQVSEAVTMLVANAAPALTAIRVGPNRHVTGFLWRNDLIVTSDQGLPAAGGYSIVLSNGALASGRPGPRDPVHNLAAILLDSVVPAVLPEPASSTAIGALVVALGVDFDGSPTARLTAIHGFPRPRAGGAEGAAITLDLAGGRVSPGGMVLDADGRLLGMVNLSPGGEGIVVPHGVIARFVELATGAPAATGETLGAVPGAEPPVSPPAQAQAPSHAPLSASPSLPAMRPIPPVDMGATRPLVQNGHGSVIRSEPVRNGSGHGARDHGGGRRGWLGVSLQPITVPDVLVPRAGQSTARQVIGITRGGPADMAGLRSGDVLLALDGTSTTGPQTLRAFLVPERIGSQVEVRLMREGVIHIATLTVAAQPDG